jgi:hypothetical protein
MDEANKAKAAEWIRSWVIPVCPSCQSGEPFYILDELVAAPILKGGVATTNRYVPLIGLICGVCGNVRFFSAVSAGLVPPQPVTAPTSIQTSAPESK